VSAEIIQFPSSQATEAPTPDAPSPDTGARKSGNAFLNFMLKSIAVLYLVNGFGLFAAICFGSFQTAMLFVLGMCGASLAMIGTGTMLGCRR
jgi:hypothetical protein